MRDALGGTVTLVIIVMFIVITLGYMAFNVNYTKAFRMKNKIISLYEEYEGVCTNECQTKIRNYAKDLGYSTLDGECPSYAPNKSTYYCYKANTTQTGSEAGYETYKTYYTIVTKINVDVPVINRIFEFRAFQITGDTKTFDYYRQ